jgi:hypothetical protein
MAMARSFRSHCPLDVLHFRRKRMKSFSIHSSAQAILVLLRWH